MAFSSFRSVLLFKNSEHLVVAHVKSTALVSYLGRRLV